MKGYSHYLNVITVIFMTALISAGYSAPPASSPGTDTALGSTTVGELKKIVDNAASESGAAGAQVAVILGEQRTGYQPSGSGVSGEKGRLNSIHAV